jgi:uncharacterized cupredoxin-like copper-binding protein
MKKVAIAILSAVATAFVASGVVMAAGDMTEQKPVEIRVELGDKENARRFFPANLELETGKLYKLVLHNASGEKHYFSSEGLSRAVFTRKAQVLGRDGKPAAEIKGFIREIEVYPSETAEWWFVPVKAGVLDDLVCTIEGHAEAGMVGVITIR